MKKKKTDFVLGGWGSADFLHYILGEYAVQKKEEIYWGCLLQTNKNSVNFMESITQGN